MIADPRRCPYHLQTSLLAYASQGFPVGGFLQAVLENNLRDAALTADAENAPLLAHIVAFVYDQLPAGSWGSPAAVRKHYKSKANDRKRAARHG